jgi:hypothetical protein
MEDLQPRKTDFVFPRLLQQEMGEIERVAAYVGEDPKIFVPRFLRATLPRYERATFAPLDERIWMQLKNTDSVSIRKGDWDTVQQACQGRRDWEAIRARMEKGESLDAPIIVRLPNEYHLVSGNTRLMCARALGIAPKVLIVDLSRES